nr:hypothetical protein Q903MT_gene5910 [Picea sitchensis]
MNSTVPPAHSMEGFHFHLNWHFHLHRKEALVRADGLTDFNPTASGWIPSTRGSEAQRMI